MKSEDILMDKMEDSARKIVSATTPMVSTWKVISPIVACLAYQQIATTW